MTAEAMIESLLENDVGRLLERLDEMGRDRDGLAPVPCVTQRPSLEQAWPGLQVTPPFVHVGWAHDEEMRNRAQSREMFDWLVGRTVFSQSD